MKYFNNHYGTQQFTGKKINLQYFAEDDKESENAEDDTEGNDAENGAGTEGEKKGPRMYSKKELGSIVSKEVSKALEAYKASEKAVSEGEKLENMTAEQRRAVEDKRRDDEIAALKNQLAQNSLKDSAVKSLTDEGLSADTDMLALVVGADADATAANIKAIKAVIAKAIQAAEKARNTGTTPKIVTGDGKRMTKKELVAKGYKAVQEYKQQHPDEYKEIMEG